MKIKTWIKYEESYLPPRCRKLRYRECEEYIDIPLREVDISDVKLAFEDVSYGGKGKIYHYRGKLYSKVKLPNQTLLEECEMRGIRIKSALDWLIWVSENSSAYFMTAFDRIYLNRDTSRDAVIATAKKNMANCLLVSGELYEVTREPSYCIATFGIGNNHGGTCLFCDYWYNENIRRDFYFSALDGDLAVAKANEIAAKRGDTNDVGRFEPFIIIHMPELAKIKSKKTNKETNN